MTDIAARLQQIRDLLSDPKRHAVGELAKDKLGRRVSSHSNNAVCWCLLGAIGKFSPTGTDPMPVVMALHEELPADAVKRASSYTTDLHQFNDKHPEEILPLIDRAIATASGATS